MTCLEELTVGSASASSPTACRWKYDVFLSFRGEDTRKGFTDHLYDKLKWRAIKTFRDDPELQRGTSIHPELLMAIQQSRFAIVVISPNYAASTWCLVELTKILQSMDESETILPVFYDVDPSDVRHQKGSFAEAFVKHEEKFREDIEKVQGWRDALAKVANLAGWTSKDYRYETELIKEIVEVVWNKVHPTLTLLDSSEILRRFVFSSVNCLRLVGYQGSNNIIYSMLKRFLQEIPHFVDRFSIIIPGCEIPEWFTNQSVGHSLTEKLPLHAGNSEWMGFALCAVFVSHENPAVVREVDYLQTYANEICCQWKIPGSQFEGVSFYNRLGHVVSDHLLLVLLSRQHYNFLEEKRCQIKFGFKTRRAVGNKKCLKVKKCGVRSVYEQDVEDLNRTMNLSNNNNSLHEAVHIPHCDF
ncbi:unnamed protein product [Malus baccata var. baccata]